MRTRKALLTIALSAGLVVSSAMAQQADVGSASPTVPSASTAAGRTQLAASLPLKRESEVAAPSGAYLAWIIVLAVALGGVWVARRAAGERFGFRLRVRPNANVLRVVASRSLSAQASVQVVEWSGKQYLLGCAQGGVSVIDSRPIEESQ